MTGAIDFCWWYHQTGCSGAGSHEPLRQARLPRQGGQPHDAHARPAGRGHERLPVQQPDVLPARRPGLERRSRRPQTDNDCSGSTRPQLLVHERAALPVHLPGQRPGRDVQLHRRRRRVGFINGQLAVDLGGVHGAASGSVTLDAAEATTLGLVGRRHVLDRPLPGRAPHLRLDLHADAERLHPHGVAVRHGLRRRHRRRQRGLRRRRQQRHATAPATPTARWRPYCGDAIVQNPPEQCDDGTNQATYGGSSKECGPGCKFAPYCGDGAKNGPKRATRGRATASGHRLREELCTTACTARPRSAATRSPRSSSVSSATTA